VVLEVPSYVCCFVRVVFSCCQLLDVAGRSSTDVTYACLLTYFTLVVASKTFYEMPSTKYGPGILFAATSVLGVKLAKHLSGNDLSMALHCKFCCHLAEASQLQSNA
jgi:hypothetical protein